MFDEESGSMKDVSSLMKERLKADQIALLDSIAETAAHQQVSVYVVGGFVRDLLLNIQNLDIDLVVEGDGINFSEILAEKFNGRTKNYEKFGTSTLTLKGQSHIDVATARTEYYSHPAALPKVEPSSIKSDLARRDFTINSMAIKLNGQGVFSLIDFFDGEMDLKDGSIRILHDRSFIEDPCRIFRAIRFEQRFKFCIEDQTRGFMKSAIESDLINQLSGKRLLNEVKLLLKEPDPVRCVDRMKAFSLLQFFASDISNDDFRWLVMKKIDSVLIWSKMISMPKKPETWLVYFLGLFVAVKDAVFEQAVERLRFPVKISNRMRSDREHFIKARRGLNEGREPGPSEIYDIFSELSAEAVILLLAACSSERVNKYAALYFNEYYTSAKTKLTGDDLVGMGVEPGPIFKDVFKALRDARVNGQVASRDEEVLFVESQFLK